MTMRGATTNQESRATLRLVTLLAAALLPGVVACGSTDTDPSPLPTEDPPGAAAGTSRGANEAGDGELQPSPSQSGVDEDPDKDADPAAPSPPDDPAMTPATQSELVKRFAPHLHLHPSDTTRPANVDWFLSRVTMRFRHDNCPDHEVLGLGKVTQASLVAQSHDDNKSLCQHDSSKVASSTASDHFFVQIADDATRKGAPRVDWKTYVVWRPRKTGGLVDVEYWAFYAYNDGFTVFNHEADWEHVRVTIDPKGEGGQGKATEVKWSAHKGGTILSATDAKIVWELGTHPVSYVAKGSHANYPRPGTYEIPGTVVAKDEAQPASTTTPVWKTEETLVFVGTRAAPKNNQVFIKYWGYWGANGSLPETDGITRHFP